MMKWSAIDVGGANLKLADGRGFADTIPFPLWEAPERLASELRALLARAPSCDHLAVTMTGELADCFEDKATGVRHILNAAVEAADGRSLHVYTTDGRFVTPEVAVTQVAKIAAANWHCLARFAARYAEDESGILIDVGSTTCDVIPLWKGTPAAKGLTDTARLAHGELVYSGIERTPVCAVASHGPYRGRQIPFAAELFATMRDVYIMLDDLPEEDPLPERTGAASTADGRPATKRAATARLGRMVCADSETFHHGDAVLLARSVAERQLRHLTSAIQQVVARQPKMPTACILSGHGEFLARRAWDETALSARVDSLNAQLGLEVSRVAPAHALAVLAREQRRGSMG